MASGTRELLQVHIRDALVPWIRGVKVRNGHAATILAQVTALACQRPYRRVLVYIAAADAVIKAVAMTVYTPHSCCNVYIH